MPATGHATVAAASSLNTLLLTLAGLLVLLAGGFVTRQARLQQGQISQEEAR
jgi:hypothetical protein